MLETRERPLASYETLLTSAGFGTYFDNFIARGRQIKRYRDSRSYPETNTECLMILGRQSVTVQKQSRTALLPKIRSQGAHSRFTAQSSTFSDFTKLSKSLKVTNQGHKVKTGRLLNKK